MAKSTSTTKRTRTDGIIDADADPDAVMGALGLDDSDEPDDDEELDDDGDDTDEGDDADDDEGDDDDEDPLEALRAELREQKRTIARLTREAAARRVATKATAKPKGEAASDDSDDGETVEQAVERGREEAKIELGLERAGDRIRAALTGIIPESDLDDFIDDLKLERYVDEDGKPDLDAIKALKVRQSKITRRKPSNAGHARQGSGGVQKKSKGDLFGDTLSRLGL